MRPDPGQVVHFSQDPTITGFVPRVAPSARHAEPYVWAVDADLAPDYWFPRDCPRAMAWRTTRSTDADVERIIGPGGGARVHAIEHRWLEPMRTTLLYGYRLPADSFGPLGTPPFAYVSTRTVRPLGPPEPVGNLIALHEAAGIQLRLLPTLGGFWAAVVASTLGFSGIRLRNAQPPGSIG